MGQYPNIKRDTYKHLNKTDTTPFDIEATARFVVGLNYGLHRFLSAALTELEQRDPSDEMALKLSELLRGGYF
jgi:hypothetical protein